MDNKTRTQNVLVSVLSAIGMVVWFIPKGKAVINLLMVLVTEHWDTIWSLIGGNNQLLRGLELKKSPGTAHEADPLEAALAFQQRQYQLLFSDEERVERAKADKAKGQNGGAQPAKAKVDKTARRK